MTRELPEKPKKMTSKYLFEAQFHITSRDQEIAEDIFWHKCMTASQIHKAYFPDVLDKNRTNVYRRLRILKDLGFIDVFRPMDRRPVTVFAPGQCTFRIMANDLGKRARTLKEQNRRALYSIQLKHTIATTGTYVGFLDSQHQGQGELGGWDEGACLRHKFYYQRWNTITPDARYEWYPDNSTESMKIYVEVDCGTENLDRIEEKTMKYVLFMKSGKYIRREGSYYFPTVLFVVNSRSRAKAVSRAILSGTLRVSAHPDYIARFISFAVGTLDDIEEKGMASDI